MSPQRFPIRRLRPEPRPCPARPPRPHHLRAVGRCYTTLRPEPARSWQLGRAGSPNRGEGARLPSETTASRSPWRLQSSSWMSGYREGWSAFHLGALADRYSPRIGHNLGGEDVHKGYTAIGPLAAAAMCEPGSDCECAWRPFRRALGPSSGGLALLVGGGALGASRLQASCSVGMTTNARSPRAEGGSPVPSVRRRSGRPPRSARAAQPSSVATSAPATLRRGLSRAIPCDDSAHQHQPWSFIGDRHLENLNRPRRNRRVRSAMTARSPASSALTSPAPTTEGPRAPAPKVGSGFSREPRNPVVAPRRLVLNGGPSPGEARSPGREARGGRILDVFNRRDGKQRSGRVRSPPGDGSRLTPAS
jgi:hypothetical protein